MAKGGSGTQENPIKKEGCWAGGEVAEGRTNVFWNKNTKNKEGRIDKNLKIRDGPKRCTKDS